MIDMPFLPRASSLPPSRSSARPQSLPLIVYPLLVVLPLISLCPPFHFLFYSLSFLVVLALVPCCPQYLCYPRLLARLFPLPAFHIDSLITSHHITSSHQTTPHHTVHQVTALHLISHLVTSHLIPSNHTISYRTTPHHTPSHHITSHNTTAHLITSHQHTLHDTRPDQTTPHLVSHYITSHQCTSTTLHHLTIRQNHSTPLRCAAHTSNHIEAPHITSNTFVSRRIASHYIRWTVSDCLKN